MISHLLNERRCDGGHRLGNPLVEHILGTPTPLERAKSLGYDTGTEQLNIRAADPAGGPAIPAAESDNEVYGPPQRPRPRRRPRTTGWW
jgi:hypothetical protein